MLLCYKGEQDLESCRYCLLNIFMCCDLYSQMHRDTKAVYTTGQRGREVLSHWKLLACDLRCRSGLHFVAISLHQATCFDLRPLKQKG